MNRPVRSAVPLAALLSLLLSSGCFWLEPIDAYPGPDPDAGTISDGGTDGGTDGGVTCGPDAPVPDGAQVAFEIGSVVRFLDQGDFRVTLRLNQAFEEPVWVRLGSTAPSVAAPDASGLCFAAGVTSQEVGVSVYAAGEVVIQATVAGQAPAVLSASLRERPMDPVLTGLSPSRAFVLPGTEMDLTVQLSGPALEPETVSFSITGAPGIAPVEIPAGASSGLARISIPSNLADGTEIQVTATLTTGEGTAAATLRAGGVVISEVLWKADGFVELHNPTQTAVNIRNWQLNVRQTAGGDRSVNLYQFTGETLIQPGGYLLVGMWNYTGSYDVRTGSEPQVMGWTQFRLRTIRPQGPSGETDDNVRFGDDGGTPPPTVKSVERMAWGDATALDMATGRYVSSGNGWDTDSISDFIERDVPDPQGTQSTPEWID